MAIDLTAYKMTLDLKKELEDKINKLTLLYHEKYREYMESLIKEYSETLKKLGFDVYQSTTYKDQMANMWRYTGKIGELIIMLIVPSLNKMYHHHNYFEIEIMKESLPRTHRFDVVPIAEIPAYISKVNLEKDIEDCENLYNNLSLNLPFTLIQYCWNRPPEAKNSVTISIKETITKKTIPNISTFILSEFKL